MAMVRGKVLPFRGRIGERRTTDLDLLWSAALGDNTALRDLFYRHGDLVFRVFRVDCRLDARTAGRLLRDTFLEAWRSVGDFDARLSVAGWIVRIALRIGARSRFTPLATTPAGATAIATPIPELDANGGTVEGASLEARVAALSWETHLAIVLVDRERMDAGEVADALGVKPRVIWRWVANGRSRTRGANGERSVVRRASRLRLALATGRLCPPAWVLNKEVSGEITPRVGWHLSACPDCARELAELFRIADRIAALPRPEMGAALKNEIAVSLLTAPIGGLQPRG